MVTRLVFQQFKVDTSKNFFWSPILHKTMKLHVQLHQTLLFVTIGGISTRCSHHFLQLVVSDMCINPHTKTNSLVKFPHKQSRAFHDRKQ